VCSTFYAKAIIPWKEGIIRLCVQCDYCVAEHGLKSRNRFHFVKHKSQYDYINTWSVAAEFNVSSCMLIYSKHFVPSCCHNTSHEILNYVKILSLMLGYSVWFWLVNKIESWFILMGLKKFITSIVSGIALTLKPNIWKDKKCLHSYCN